MYIYGRGFGQAGTNEQVIEAAKGYKQMLDEGKLIRTIQTSENATFAFDPKEPDIIYAVEPYFGNGPSNPGFTAVAPAKFRYNSGTQLPWMGADITADAWLSQQPPEVQAPVRAKLGLPPLPPPEPPPGETPPSPAPVPGMELMPQDGGFSLGMVGVGVAIIGLAAFLILRKRKESSE